MVRGFGFDPRNKIAYSHNKFSLLGGWTREYSWVTFKARVWSWVTLKA